MIIGLLQLIFKLANKAQIKLKKLQNKQPELNSEDFFLIMIILPIQLLNGKRC